MASYTEEKITIQGRVGILTIPKNPSLPHKIAVILHGHGGHKNYTYQRQVAWKISEKPLGIYSFRFDFRGCGESIDVEDPILTGRTLESDYQDIDTVINYLKNDKKFQIHSIIGHSRGSVTALRYVLHYHPEIPRIVNCSARYFSKHTIKFNDFITAKHPDWREKGGYYEYAPRFNQSKLLWFPANESLDLADTEMVDIVGKAPSVQVLTIHGTKDNIVPLSDAVCYANALDGRHTLKIVYNADHNFYGIDSKTNKRLSYANQVADYIVEWFSNKNESKRFIKSQMYVDKTPRFKNIPNIPNFRDLGGYIIEASIQNEISVRSDFIFRSANLTEINDEGINILKSLNIRRIFDLRSNIEIQKNGFANIPSIQRSHIPVYKDQDYSPEAVAERLKTYSSESEGFLVVYNSILKSAGKAYREIFLHIRDRPTDPFVIHCTAGKDRTGIVCALILLLAGVDSETVSRDYELTEFGLKDYKEKLLNSIAAKHPNNNENRDTLKTLLGSQYETMIHTIHQLINGKFGGVENYLLTYCGLEKNDVDKIKRNLILKDHPSSIFGSAKL